MKKELHYVVEDIKADQSSPTFFHSALSFGNYLEDCGICCASSGPGGRIIFFLKNKILPNQ